MFYRLWQSGIRLFVWGGDTLWAKSDGMGRRGGEGRKFSGDRPTDQWTECSLHSHLLSVRRAQKLAGRITGRCMSPPQPQLRRRQRRRISLSTLCENWSSTVCYAALVTIAVWSAVIRVYTCGEAACVRQCSVAAITVTVTSLSRFPTVNDATAGNTQEWRRMY